jgi:hypothetical protein
MNNQNFAAPQRTRLFGTILATDVCWAARGFPGRPHSTSLPNPVILAVEFAQQAALPIGFKQALCPGGSDEQKNQSISASDWFRAIFGKIINFNWVLIFGKIGFLFL